jgi:phospholipid/cholesterol/gamma-HCH transport system substrate-binding protein
MKKYKNEIALGSFTLVAAILLGYMTLTVGKFHFGPTTNVKAIFESASGVVKDAVVMVAGVEVGTIKSINLENNKAVMNITLNDDIKISKNVKAVIRAKSLLGEKFVELIPYKSNDFLTDGDVIKNTTTPVEIDQLVTTLGPILIKLGPVLEKVNPEDITDMFKTISQGLKGKEKYISRIITNIDQLLTFFTANEGKMNRIMNNVDALSVDARGLINNNRSGINRIVNNTDKIMNDFGGRSDKIAQRIDVITANLNDITNDFQKNSPNIIKKVDVITDDLKAMSSDFRKNAPDLAKQVGSVTKNLDSLMASLNKDAPDLAKDLATVSKSLAGLSGQIAKKGPKMIDNTDELLAKLVVTLNRLEPLMLRLEKFDDKAIVKEVERIMKQVGIKVNLY